MQYLIRPTSNRGLVAKPTWPCFSTFQVFPTSSPEILHHTLCRTWLFIASWFIIIIAFHDIHAGACAIHYTNIFANKKSTDLTFPHTIKFKERLQYIGCHCHASPENVLKLWSWQIQWQIISEIASDNKIITKVSYRKNIMICQWLSCRSIICLRAVASLACLLLWHELANAHARLLIE